MPRIPSEVITEVTATIERLKQLLFANEGRLRVIFQWGHRSHTPDQDAFNDVLHALLTSDAETMQQVHGLSIDDYNLCMTILVWTGRNSIMALTGSSAALDLMYLKRKFSESDIHKGEEIIMRIARHLRAQTAEA